MDLFFSLLGEQKTNPSHVAETVRSVDSAIASQLSCLPSFETCNHDVRPELSEHISLAQREVI